jgi:hypothetical protein
VLLFIKNTKTLLPWRQANNNLKNNILAHFFGKNVEKMRLKFLREEIC